LGESTHTDFYRYRVEHETNRPLTVRFNQIRKNSVIVIEDFEIFVPKNNTYLWAKTNSKSVNEALKRIKITEENCGRTFAYREHKVDLVKLGKDYQSTIRGGYFNQLSIADLRAAAIFGPTVGGSEDWHRYEDSGKVSAISFEATYRGEAFLVMVTTNGGIVVFPNLNELEYLEFIEQINDEIGKYFITG
jgi:hypothetical protein